MGAWDLTGCGVAEALRNLLARTGVVLGGLGAAFRGGGEDILKAIDSIPTSGGAPRGMHSAAKGLAAAAVRAGMATEATVKWICAGACLDAAVLMGHLLSTGGSLFPGSRPDAGIALESMHVTQLCMPAVLLASTMCGTVACLVED